MTNLLYASLGTVRYLYLGLVPKRSEKHCKFFIWPSLNVGQNNVYPTHVLLYFIIIKHTRLWWQKSSCLNSKQAHSHSNSLSVTKQSRSCWSIINDRVLIPQSLMVCFGTECIVHIFLVIFSKCMVILVLFYSWQTAIIFFTQPMS
jgi:hypothetical protein